MSGFLYGSPCDCKQPLEPGRGRFSTAAARMDNGPDRAEVFGWVKRSSAYWRCPHGNVYLVVKDLVATNGAFFDPDIYGPILHGPLPDPPPVDPVWVGP